MGGQKILVIDDSTTIRRLVDSYLSPEGYQVVLAPTAEEGLELAAQLQPDLILLDHQLPGTTGLEVCRHLAEMPVVSQTPVVVSSTLRKRAYVEYTDLPNVVDMLPKPYTAELLKTTVANALDTGALVVQSQQQGTAVPEVIHELGEPDLAGNCRDFCPREVLDFLNNNAKRGTVEFEAEFRRTTFYLDRGRIVGVTATGIDVEQLTQRLPASLQSLGPVLRLSVGGRSDNGIDGITELLDRKMLDPRLLRKLLRCQAAILGFDCLTQPVTNFRFLSSRAAPPLLQKLPLDISLLALSLEGAFLCEEACLPPVKEHAAFLRRMTRGQNLDRAGVSAQHMKLFGLLSEPQSVESLVRQLGWEEEEVRRVLFGLLSVDAVEMRSESQAGSVVVFETNAAAAHRLREYLEQHPSPYPIRVVKDRLALQMALKRAHPTVIVFSLDTDESIRLLRDLYLARRPEGVQAKLVGIVPTEGEPNAREHWSAKVQLELEQIVTRPYRPEQLQHILDQLGAPSGDEPPQEPSGPATEVEPQAAEETRNPTYHEQSCTIDA